MAQLPPVRRLVVQDYQSQQGWIGPLLQNLNNFMDAVFNSLNKSLTIAQNSTGDVKTIMLSTTPTASAPLSLPWSKTNRPTAVFVGNVTRVDGASFTLTSAVQVQWVFVAPSSIQITNVTGVTPSSTDQYLIQLTIFTG